MRRIPVFSRPNQGTAIAVAMTYLMFFPYHPALRSPNELCRLWQSIALVENASLEINAVLQKYGQVGDLSVVDGRFYPSKAPFLSFAAVPVVAALRWHYGNTIPEVPLIYFSRLLLTVAPTLITLLLLRRLLARFASPSVADWIAGTYALGSLAFSYSELFMSHQTTANLLLWGIMAAEVAFRRTSWTAAAAAGLCFGSVVGCEYTGALGLVGAVAYYLTYLRNTRIQKWSLIVLLGVLGAALPIALLLLYHKHCFGAYLDTGYKHLNDPQYVHWHQGGFLGVRLPNTNAFVQSLFSPLRGLFILSPFLLIGFAGMRRLWTLHAPTCMFTVTLCLLSLYFTSAFAYDSWGWTTGPRHLTQLALAMTPAIAVAVESVRRSRRWAGVTIGLCATSLFVTMLLTTINYIQDKASSPLFSLLLPILRDGANIPTTVSTFLPARAATFVLLVWVVCIVLAHIVRGTAIIIGSGHAATRTRTVAIGIVLLWIGGLKLAYRDDAGDHEALGHLRSWWSPAALVSRPNREAAR